jgi:hypothetical protein
VPPQAPVLILSIPLLLLSLLLSLLVVVAREHTLTASVYVCVGGPVVPTF